MQTVVDIINSKIVVHEVPDDFIRCSVTGTYSPKSEFERNGERVRTNNEYSYHLSVDEYCRTKEETEKIQKSSEFRNEIEKLNEVRNFIFENSIPVEEMIIQLSKLPKGSRLVITQEGYYADGELADIHIPEKQRFGQNIYSIGHSAQNY